MKKILLSVIVLVYVNITMSQTRNDVVNFNNPNLKLLDSLILEEATKQRNLLNLQPIVKNKICSDAAKYQSEYMSYYHTIGHKNDKPYKNVILEKPINRFSYFYSKSQEKRTFFNFYEILTSCPDLDYHNYNGLNTKTYQNFAEVFIKAYMDSPSHRKGLLRSSDSEIHGSFRTHYDKNTKSFYVTGLFALLSRWN